MSSESILLQSVFNDRNNIHLADTGTESTIIPNDIVVSKVKRLQIPNIEEKLRVKSPHQIFPLKMKMKTEETAQSKAKSSNVISTQLDAIYRKDHNGVEIKASNKKKVKVTFIDKIAEKELVEVVHIENFKEYNIVPYATPEEHFAKTRHCCSCIII